ncbi:MAG: hypothetical protein JSS40_15450 [Proteobacteria bacterium]|nr:hypothetical protein [Pseudomonadota bacterium]
MNRAVTSAYTDGIPSAVLVSIEESMGALDLGRSLRQKFLFTGRDPQARREYDH